MSLRCALTAATLAALVLSADAATAPAADWRHVEPAPPRAVAFDRFVPDARDGIWAFDDGAVRHIDASGRATVADRVLLGVDGARREFGDGLALADGGAIVFSRGDGACRIGRVDAQAHLAWSRDEPDGCARIAADAGGTTWFSGLRRLARIGRDGAMTAQVDLSIFGLVDTTALAVDADGGAIVAVRDARQNASTHVASYAPDGRQRWVRDGGSASVTAIAILANGDVVTAGIGAAGQRGPLQIAAMSPDGTPRWTRTVTGDEDDSQAQLFADADGLVVVGHHAVGSTGTSTTVARLTHAGAVRWQASSCNGRFDRATASPAGDVAVGCIDRTPGLHRWNEDGQRAAFIAVPWSYVTDLDFGPRGTLLATGYTDPPPAGGEINALAFDVAGNAVASPLAGVVQSDIGEALAQHVAPDGTTYLASRSGYLYGPRGERLSKIDARGNVLWSRDIGHRLRATDGIVARADRVCATGRFLPSSGFDAYAWTSLCLDAATGDILWQEGVSATQTQSFAGLLDDGRLFAVFAGNGAFQVMRIDRDGRPRLAPPIAGVPVAATIEGSGRTTVAIANSPYQPTALNVVRLDANGAVVFSTNEPASASPLFPIALAVAPDGTSYLLAATGSGGDLRAIDANGTLRWRKAIAFSTGYAPPFGNLLATRDAVYVYQNASTPPSDAPPDTNWVTRIAAADGAIEWRRSTSSPAAQQKAGVMALDDAGDTLIVATTNENRLRLQTIATATGQPRQDRTIRCADACSPPVGVGLGRDGTARVGITGIDTWAGQAAFLLGVDMTAPPPTRLDQPGIAGAWWSPYANGEGFVLDYLPDSRTLFMPWFTFSRDGGNDPAGQRWFVVQGQVPANAVEVELPITESTGGAFDAGPATTPAIVGKATLTFTDCDNGTLRYRFDEGRNGGATGTITLSRLSPATHECLLADGTTQTRTSAPANGFDARMSGSWFEPATSGQGLQLTVQPGGIFFAPWFTYDPAGNPDDPGKQRWYTVQGSLANARNGVAELPIVQTIGGAFDSVPTNNMYTVGKATITMLACDRATLDYRFDDNELAAPMRARSGSIDLVKAGGCAP